MTKEQLNTIRTRCKTAIPSGRVELGDSAALERLLVIHSDVYDLLNEIDKLENEVEDLRTRREDLEKQLAKRLKQTNALRIENHTLKNTTMSTTITGVRTKKKLGGWWVVVDLSNGSSLVAERDLDKDEAEHLASKKRNEYKLLPKDVQYHEEKQPIDEQ